jgi:hypothetical protein
MAWQTIPFISIQSGYDYALYLREDCISKVRAYCKLSRQLSFFTSTLHASKPYDPSLTGFLMSIMECPFPANQRQSHCMLNREMLQGAQQQNPTQPYNSPTILPPPETLPIAWSQ